MHTRHVNTVSCEPLTHKGTCILRLSSMCFMGGVHWACTICDENALLCGKIVANHSVSTHKFLAGEKTCVRGTLMFQKIAYWSNYRDRNMPSKALTVRVATVAWTDDDRQSFFPVYEKWCARLWLDDSSAPHVYGTLAHDLNDAGRVFNLPAPVVSSVIVQPAK